MESQRREGLPPVGKASFIASLETDVPVTRSVDHIRHLVERFGAMEFGIQYDPVSGRPCAVSFKVKDPHVGAGLPVALRAPYETVLKQILDGKKRSWDSDVKARAKEQAERVAWRNLHDFVRASLIGVQTGIMSLGEAFLANLVVTLPTGEAKRLGELVIERNLLHPAPEG